MGHLQLAAVAVLILVVGQSQGSSVNRFPPRLDKQFQPRFEDRSAYFEGPNLRSFVPRDDVPNYRLPNNTNPVHYDITLTTNVHAGDQNFRGVVVITLRVDEELTTSIVVHARQLENFTSTLVDTVTGTGRKLSPFYDSAREFLTLTPEDNSELIQGRTYTLTIAYDGNLRLDSRGFYMSTYKNSSGDTVYLAATQFESTNARHGFPCYDEPARRAAFTLTINHSPSYTAISNMPVDATKSSNGKTVFLESPKMSTYVVAYIVSMFEYTSGSLNGLTHRTFSRPGTRREREFALFSGIQTSARLADYLDVPFTLPKLDQVAVPGYGGAMENWGIATYGEHHLLYNPQKTPISNQTYTANVIAHELAHMWFGDLVTIKWWTYLWLKEGFATLFSYKAADEVHPEWGIIQMFIVDDYQLALTYDGGASPRAMTHYAQTPTEISSLYDTVSYGKAGAVLSMWQHALTDDVFSAGLNKYLRLNEFTAAEEDDLFEAIGSAAKDNGIALPDTVKAMMGSWTEKGGVPLLTVERNYDTGTVKITQTSFYNDPQLKDDRLWYVPVNYATSKYSDFRNTAAEYYLNNTQAIDIEDTQLASDDWLILNKQSTGYYRVQYDERNWDLISNGIIAKPHRIHPHNRAALLNDAHRLVESNRLKHSILLKLMTYLQGEDQYAPWSTASSIITTANKFLSGDGDYTFFRYYVRDLVANIYNRLGLDKAKGEQHFQNNVRTIAIDLACLVDVESCLTDTNNKLKAFVRNDIEIELNLRPSIFCNGLRLRQTDDTEFDFVYNRLMSSDDHVERRVLIASLGCAKNSNHVKKFIESSISRAVEVTLSVHERTQILSSAYSRGEDGLLASIEFLDVHHVAYAGLTTGSGEPNPLNSDIIGLSNYVVNDQQASKLRDLVEKVKSQPGFSATLEATVEANIQSNFNWLDKNLGPISDWIREHRSSAGRRFPSMLPAIAAVCCLIVRFF